MISNGLVLRLLPLAVVAVTVVVVVVIGRRLPPQRVTQGARILAVATLAGEAVWWLDAFAHHNWSLRYNLPLHLCEAAAIVISLALWSRRALLVELGYFWGLGGALQALLTPVIPFSYPHLIWFQYYFEHGIIVLAALYLVLVMRLRPRTGAVTRVAGVTIAYAIAVGVADWITGGNYMYLRSIPVTGTVLDLLGPWPWYLIPCAIVAIALFAILYVPFRNHGTAQLKEQGAGA